MYLRKLLPLFLAGACLAGSFVFADESSVRAVLADGKGDFDPWNQTRWAAWYKDGQLAKPFTIDTSVRFAAREGAWMPEVSGLQKEGNLFIVSDAGIVVDGNGVVVDLTTEACRGRTLDQLYDESKGKINEAYGLARGIVFRTGFKADAPANRLVNFTIMGCVQGGLVARSNTHPLRVEHSTFSRNSTGFYISGTAATLSRCAFFENSVGASYNGSGSWGNCFEENSYRDNNYGQSFSYADLIFDTAYDNVVVGNHFLPSQASQPHFRAALSFYRNMGEDGGLREDYPRRNRVDGNVIDGYSVGINVGARQGRVEHRHDLAKEGRDYAADNLFKDNTIRNTAIGIKLNTSGNTVEGNVFENVELPIVLHCVGYNLMGTDIRRQNGVTVALWTQVGDDGKYAAWFPYQRIGMPMTPPEEKIVQVNAEPGVVFSPMATGSFVNAPTLLSDDTLCALRSAGPAPSALAVGDFYENQPGEELAVAWDAPNTRIKKTTYYDIVFFESDGIEINRSARSETKWGGLAAGRFFYGKGEQVAAFTDAPVDGKYPLSVFRRGFAEPHKVLLADNTRKIRAIAAGNFDPADPAEEIAVVFEADPSRVVFVKPGNPAWSASASAPVALAGIAGGRFNPEKPGAQVAGIGAVPDRISGGWPVYFLQVGTAAAYAKSARACPQRWSAIAAGDFDPARPGDEVAVSSTAPEAGFYPVFCLRPGEETPFKKMVSPVLAAPARALAAGRPPMKATLSGYERVAGISPEAAVREVPLWGDAVAVLPSSAPGGIPVFWLSAPPDGSQKLFLRTTPVLR